MQNKFLSLLIKINIISGYRLPSAKYLQQKKKKKEKFTNIKFKILLNVFYSNYNKCIQTNYYIIL